jgi:hypothetical protein
MLSPGKVERRLVLFIPRQVERRDSPYFDLNGVERRRLFVFSPWQVEG